MSIVTALQTLRPNAEWVLRGDELEWLDANQTQPSDAEIAAEIARLQAAHVATQYQRDRVYPPIGDQLDAMWKGGDAEIAMRKMVLAVKAQYPKP